MTKAQLLAENEKLQAQVKTLLRVLDEEVEHLEMPDCVLREIAYMAVYIAQLRRDRRQIARERDGFRKLAECRRKVICKLQDLYAHNGKYLGRDELHDAILIANRERII